MVIKLFEETFFRDVMWAFCLFSDSCYYSFGINQKKDAVEIIFSENRGTNYCTKKVLMFYLIGLVVTLLEEKGKRRTLTMSEIEESIPCTKKVLRQLQWVN